MMRLLIEFKKIVPDFVRIKRVMRDISEHKADAGAKTTNLRQLAAIRMKHSGLRCRCIRCREVGHVERIEGNTELKRAEYGASGGREIFLSYESRNALFAFLRLRLGKIARIRELHVYGSMVPISKNAKTKYAKQTDTEGVLHLAPAAFQHTGFGKSLMEEAKKIAMENGCRKITVTSGVGAKEYYRNLGYRFETPYIVKKLIA